MMCLFKYRHIIDKMQPNNDYFGQEYKQEKLRIKKISLISNVGKVDNPVILYMKNLINSHSSVRGVSHMI